jgi:hypothetical protein
MLHHGKFVIRAGRKSGSIAMDRLDFSERGSTPAYPFKKTRHRCRNGARSLVVRSEPHEMTNARGERCDATGARRLALGLPMPKRPVHQPCTDYLLTMERCHDLIRETHS